MSIYATLEHFYVPKLPISAKFPEEFIKIVVQGVPSHIDYTGPAWDFLPPPVPEEDDTYRFVVVCGPETRKGTERNSQEYVNPLFTLTGEEYARIGWDVLWRRISEVLEPIFAEARQAHNRLSRKELEARRAQRESVTTT